MKIPLDAIIAQEKLTEYLLVLKERNDKSQYFARGGFRLETWREFESAIRWLCATTEANEGRIDEWGTFFTVSGDLPTLVGDPLPVTIVWIRRSSDGSVVPRIVERR